MKRTIKFRIWNNKTKSWIHGPHERPDLDGVNLFGENILFGNLLDGVGIEDLNDIVAFQFTGATDKNGKEIFEGDILNSKPSRYKVFFDEGCWKVESIMGMNVGKIQFLNNVIEYSFVIGNVYEKEYEEAKNI